MALCAYCIALGGFLCRARPCLTSLAPTPLPLCAAPGPSAASSPPPAAAPTSGPSYAGAPTQQASRSVGIRTFDQHGTSGAGHLVSDGSLKASDASGSPAFPSRGPRGLEAQPRPPPGGASSLVLGSDTHTYECSTKESQWRVAVDPGAAAAAREEPVAGGRLPPEELGVRRRNGVVVHPTVPVGGRATLSLADGSEAVTYTGGIKEAQCQVALLPEARAAAAALPMAGLRVEPKWLGAVARHTVAPGGREAYDWGKGGPNDATLDAPAEGSAGGAPPPSPSKKAQEVGGESARFLTVLERAAAVRSSRDSSVGALLGGGGEGGGGEGGGGAPMSPRAARFRAQDLGGRGLRASGFAGGLDEPDPRIGVFAKSS